MVSTNNALSLFFRRFICLLLAVCMVFQTGKNNEVKASWATVAYFTWNAVKPYVIAIGADVAVSSIVSYFSKNSDSGNDDEWYDFLTSEGFDPNDYDSLEDLINDPEFLKVMEALDYNAGDYIDSDDLSLQGYSSVTGQTVNDYFNSWRLIEDGYADDFYTGDSNYLTEIEAQKNSIDNGVILKTTPQLVEDGSLALLYNAMNGSLEPNSIMLYDKTYFSSNYFSFSEDVVFDYGSVRNLYKDNSHSVTNGSFYSSENENSFIHYYGFSLYEYSGEYLNDSKFLEPLTNIKWEKVDDLNLKADTYYTIIFYSYLKNYHGYDRIQSYSYIPSPNFDYYVNGVMNSTDYFSKSPEGIDSPVYTSIINNYTNYYVDGNWYNGDYEDNSDNSTNNGGGSGSGDGTVSGDLNVHVDGELDHNLDGSIDVNVNIEGGSSDPEETNSIIAWILNNILSFIGNCITFVLDSLYLLFESLLLEFLDWIPDLINTDFFTAISSIFGWLPERVANFITFSILIALAIGIFGYFKR